MLIGDLKANYPEREITEALEVTPSGLRKGPWTEMLRGLSVVAAPEQTTEIVWKNGRFNLGVKVPSQEAQARLLRRLQRIYGTSMTANVEVMDNPALAGVPSVALVDCTIFFEAAQRDFMTSEAEKLQRVFEIMEAHPEVRLSIEGHTDDKGAFYANASTSLSRADTVRKWLMRRKIEPERISVHGNGSKFPIADNKTEPGRAANRRLEFRIR
jgi:outer membrane protein OmpA-like peptidoglycan-associated protein